MGVQRSFIRKGLTVLTTLALVVLAVVLIQSGHPETAQVQPEPFILRPDRGALKSSLSLPPKALALQEAALAEVGVTVLYDPSYVKMAYPNGDVPMDRGVCTDVVIRALRKMGIDLQLRVHEDIEKNPSAYPQLWGRQRPDASIDHRRVPNLMTYYRRQGWELPVTTNPADYRGGDIVVWRLPSGALHTAVVYARASGGPLVVHNIGQGTQCEDVLFAWKLVGHYRVPEAAMK